MSWFLLVLFEFYSNLSRLAYLEYREVYNLMNSFKCVNSKREDLWYKWIGTVMPSNIISLITYKALFWLDMHNIDILVVNFDENGRI